MRADLFLRLRSLLRRKHVEQELDEELQFHFEREVEKHLKNGVTPEEAKRRARIVFGGLDQVKEECRQARGVSLLENVAQDVRYALRTLRKSPAFAVCAVFTLALGIAATTVAFSVVDSILLNPVPFKEADRLVEIWSWSKNGGGPHQAPAMLQHWREQTQIFDQVEAHTESSFALTGATDPEVVFGSQITAGLFRFLGIRPEIGRDFLADESDGHVALISHDLWVRRFASSADVTGRSMRLDDDLVTIVGVMPSWFRFPDSTVEVWIPFEPLKTRPQSPRGSSVIARIRKGIPLEQADAQVALLARRLDPTLSRPGETARLNPMNRYATNGFLARLHDVKKTRTALFLIFGAAGLVLLASCVNSANLFLARALSRSREMAVRTAIGGGRFRLMCHMLSEAIVVAGLAGAAGLLMADWSLRGLTTIIPPDLLRPTLRPLGLDGRVALWAVSTSLLSGLIAALVPTLRASQGRVITALRRRSETSQRRDVRLRGLLISIETAIAVILLVGGGLMARTLWTLTHVETGFSREGLVVIQPQFRGSRYGSPASKIDFMTRLSERLRATPGVESAAIAGEVPLLPGSFSNGTIETDTGSLPEAMVTVNHVSEDYFKTLGLSIYLGRTFIAGADADSMVITRRIAESLWPGMDPLGRRLRLEGTFDWVTVIGVVDDIQSMSFDSPRDPMELYRPFSAPDRSYSSQMRYLAVKTDGGTGFLKLLQSQIRQLDPGLPADIRTADNIYAETLVEPAFQAMLLGGFAFLTLLLAVAGVYAVVMYEVSQRIQEIGIRVALGATRFTVTMQVMKRSVLLAIVGLGVGIAASLALTPLMSAMLYEIKPADPATFVAGGLLLILFVCLSAFLPARRAARVDPVVALRNE